MKKIISLSLAVLMILSTLIIVPLTASAEASIDENAFRAEIPFGQQNISDPAYGYQSMEMLTADDPEAPEGTQGDYVLKLTGDVNGTGFKVVPPVAFNLVKSFTVRVYIPGNVKSFRTYNGGYITMNSVTDGWNEYTYSKTSEGYQPSFSFASFASKEFVVYARNNAGTPTTIYVDSITFEFEDYTDEIPFSTKKVAYGSAEYNVLSAAELKTTAPANVPAEAVEAFQAGITGDYVLGLKTVGDGTLAVPIGKKINRNDVDAIKIRMWFPADAASLRVYETSGANLWLNVSEGFKKNAWNDIVLTPNAKIGGATFQYDKIWDEEGNLKNIEVGIRRGAEYAYVDCVSFVKFTDNVALNGAVMATNSIENWVTWYAKFITDGKVEAAGWHSTTAIDAEHPAYVTVSLQDRTSVNAIRLYPTKGYDANIPNRFTLEASEDGTNWTTLTTVTGQTCTDAAPFVYVLDEPVVATQVRLVAYEKSTASNTGLSEFEVFGTPKSLIDPSWENVALGGTASATNNAWSTHVAGLVDGNTVVEGTSPSGWHAGTGAADTITVANPSYVTVALSERSTINAIKLHSLTFYSNACTMPKAFTVEVSENGTDWNEVASYNNPNRSTPLVIVLETPAVASLVRLKVTEGGDPVGGFIGTGLGEFGVYGKHTPLFDPSWVNVAMNASVSADNRTPWHDPNGLTNGTTDITGDQLWHADTGAEITVAKPATVELTLTDRSTVNAIRLYPMLIYSSSSMPKAFTIEYSNDNGENWNQIASSVGETRTSNVPVDFILDMPVVATNIRLVATEGGEQVPDNPFKGTGLTEFVVLGTPETATIHSASVSISADYKVNFKVNKAKYDAVINTGATITVTLACENGETLTNVAPVENGADYDFTFDAIGPHEFGDAITATITTTPEVGDPVVKTKTYSVAQYCKDQTKYIAINDETKLAELTKLQQVCVDLLNYGAAAQVAKGYKTETLVNAGLAEALTAKGITRDYTYTPADLATTGFAYSKGTADAYIEKANITLTNGVELNITVATTGATNGFSINGEALVFAGNKATYTKKLSFTNLLANNTFELKSGAATVSSVTYGVSVYGSRTYNTLEANYQALFARLVSLGNSIAALYA